MIASLVWAVSAGATGLRAQEDGDTVRILTLDEKIEICKGYDGLERTVCLSNLASANLSGKACEADPTGECGRIIGTFFMRDCASASGTEEEKLQCQRGVAVMFKSPESCRESDLGNLCYIEVASERRDPSVITANIEDPKIRDQALTIYAGNTGDASAADQVEDPKVADMARIYGTVSGAARSRKQVSEDICWSLRGGYAADESVGRSADESLRLCQASVRLVNSVNAQLDASETEADLDKVIGQLQELIGAAESGELDMTELMGLPPEDLEAGTAAGLVESAEEKRGRCDLVGAWETAMEIRRTDPNHPWLLVNYDAVAAAGQRQRQFRTLVDAADDLVYEAEETLNPAGFDAADDLLRAAGHFADPGCGEDRAVSQKIERNASRRELVSKYQDEVAAARAGPAEDAGADWGAYRGAMEEVDSCASYERQIQIAEEQLGKGLLENWSEWLIPVANAGCRNAAVLDQIGRALDEIRQRQANSASVTAAVGNQDTGNTLARIERTLDGIMNSAAASAQGSRVEGADETLARVYGDGQPSEPRRAPARAAGGAVTASSCTPGLTDLKPGDARTSRSYVAVAWDHGAVAVVSWPTPLTDDEVRDCGSALGCIKAVLLDPSGRGYRIAGSGYSTSAAALDAARAACP